MTKPRKAYPILRDQIKNGLVTLLVERTWSHHRKKCHYVEIIDHATGIRKEFWFDDGLWHREEGPAVIDWHQSGQKYAESWHSKGELHRQGGPAITSWWENGRPRVEIWFKHATRHRADGPSYQSWDQTGTLTRTEWYIHGHAIGDQVIEWLTANAIPPDPAQWNDDHKARFAARFSNR